ncbi:unnamed protein product [Angiostrongylus costaricensis]|uniref:TMV resistance protein N-like n=1 Tax=Angiostrongylus costaricensis TaxID=334426 RepID=A0A0R3PT85_ANGCS|nr:unnamed protein product [Angiostrongylus costaricensis]
MLEICDVKTVDLLTSAISMNTRNSRWYAVFTISLEKIGIDDDALEIDLSKALLADEDKLLELVQKKFDEMNCQKPIIEHQCKRFKLALAQTLGIIGSSIEEYSTDVGRLISEEHEVSTYGTAHIGSGDELLDDTFNTESENQLFVQFFYVSFLMFF